MNTVLFLILIIVLSVNIGIRIGFLLFERGERNEKM